jgi:hypothetical protein
MRSEQRAELVWGHADGVQDVAQCGCAEVSAAMNGHSDGAPVGMLHHVVAAVYSRHGKADLLKYSDYLRSWYYRDAARHKPARYYKSGNVECQSHLVGWPDLFDQQFQAGTQVCERSLLGFSLAERCDTRTEVRGGAPVTVLVLLQDVVHVNDSSHVFIMPWKFVAVSETNFADGADV